MEEVASNNSMSSGSPRSTWQGRAVLWDRTAVAPSWPSTTRRPYDTDTLIGALEQLLRALGGQKARLEWDGLSAPRSRLMEA